MSLAPQLLKPIFISHEVFKKFSISLYQYYNNWCMLYHCNSKHQCHNKSILQVYWNFVKIMSDWWFPIADWNNLLPQHNKKTSLTRKENLLKTGSKVSQLGWYKTYGHSYGNFHFNQVDSRIHQFSWFLFYM